MQTCPNKAISMYEDANGFLYPRIKGEKCTDCKSCYYICPFINIEDLNHDYNDVPRVYLVSHRDKAVVSRSTSGGAFTAIAETFHQENLIIFGAAFNEDMEVKHSCITGLKQMHRFSGSKYVQSDMGQCYRQAKEFLKDGKRVLFSGTPCQIAGLRSYLKKEYENLFCVDLICHGVPSPLVLRRYIEYQEKKKGKKIKHISFRDKTKYGWLQPCIRIDFTFSKKSSYTLAEDDLYGKSFLNNISLRESCYSCKFANSKRIGDMTIGDFWGAEIYYPEIKNKNGLSFVLVNTDKGRSIFNMINSLEPCIESDIGVASRNNKGLLHPVKRHKYYYSFYNDLAKMEFDNLVNKYFIPRNFLIRFLSVRLSPEIKRLVRKYLSAFNGR
jgi:coenzyme F420-reducing hydrogenase beta subunit